MKNLLFKTRNLKHKILNKLIIVLLIFYAVIESLLYLNARNYVQLPLVIVAIFRFLVLASSALLIATVFIRLTINRILDFFAEELSVEQKIFFSKVYSWIIYLISISFILYRLGISADNITLFLGLATTGFAFALRDVILSYFVWVAVLLKKPFTIDDFVRIGEEEGRVDRIGTFFITLDKSLRTANDLIKIPNKILLDKPIVNYGKGDIIETVKIKLESLPLNTNKKLESISRIVKGIIGTAHERSVNLGDANGDLYLNISFSIHFQKRKEARTRIITGIYPLIKDSLPKNK